ncbi:site-specific integrase [Aliamphritea ceti]|uniref:site-specific integrase n=1 Tax=Aliamphritea ceti TaxID=1524258 RepID=UPI0021C34BE4|nr:site-specific integrase [Aliamphritea ceti]
MQIKVATTKFEKLRGQHIPLVIVDGIVDLSAASYLLQRFDQGHPYYTIKAEANSIKKLYEFCANNGFSLAGRFAAGEHLQIGEIESLSAFYSARLDTGEPVGRKTYKLRWTQTTAFIRFIWNFYAGRLKDPVEIKASQAKLGTMNTSFQLHGKAPYSDGSSDMVGLDEELKLKFLAIINPLQDNDLNPFKSEYVRWRNYCLFLTMILGGNRRGETLGLREKDFYLSGPSGADKYFEILKDEHREYGRKDRPAAKTKERIVALNDGLAAIFTHYITNIRSKLKNAHRSEYLFLSAIDQKPISRQTPTDALNVIIKKYPEFEGQLGPHRLRNTYVDSLREEALNEYETMGPIAKKAAVSQLMEQAGGWAKGSQMPDHYAKGSIQRRVSEFTLAVQAQILQGAPDNE